MGGSHVKTTVISVLALFVSLGGGAFAAVTAIDGHSIRNHSGSGRQADPCGHPPPCHRTVAIWRNCDTIPRCRPGIPFLEDAWPLGLN
jgi:hypothetical protein